MHTRTEGLTSGHTLGQASVRIYGNLGSGNGVHTAPDVLFKDAGRDL